MLQFLTHLFRAGSGYSALNTARSALSSFLWTTSEVPIGRSSSVKRFMKGVFELRPTLPRYSFIWDVNIVLDFLKVFFPLESLPLCHLTYKLVMLLALTSAQRAQSLHALNVNDIHFAGGAAYLTITKVLKTSRPGAKNPIIIPNMFTDDPALCPVLTLKAYLTRTLLIRKNAPQLFISFVQPHAPVSKDTVSRWLNVVLRESGIDMDMFHSHSTRAAATSAAKRNNVPYDEILRTAGWSNSRSFAKFYDKPIY